jgi:tetratricopeptide (TPR) repeat protein
VRHVPPGVRLDDAQGWWQIGIHYAQHGDPARALEHFDAALARDPRLARLHRDRGLALAQLDRADEAEAELRRAIELQRDDPANYDELFAFLADPARQRFADAREVAESCVRVLPLYGKGHYDLGRAHFELYRIARGDAPPTAQDLPLLQRSREAFEKALTLPAQPQERFNAAFGLGEVERLLGTPRAALEAWRSALAALPEPDAAGWFWRCAERYLTLELQELGPQATLADLEALEQRLGSRPELAALAQRLKLR